MAIAVTTRDKESPLIVNSITLLSGAECYARDEIIILHHDVLDIKIGETWKIGYKSAHLEYLHTWDYTLHLLI